jgi:hypothetical protein
MCSRLVTVRCIRRLAKLACKSSLVRVGTVTDSRIGKVFDDDPTGNYPTQFLHTVVHVDECLKGIRPNQ